MKKDNMYNVDRLIRRTRRSWYIDGIPDLSLCILLWYAGGVNLTMSLVLPALAESLPQRQLHSGLLLVLLATSAILLLASVMRFLARGVLELKARLTYPRIGYMSPLRQSMGWQHWLFRLLSFEMCMALLIMTQTVSPTFLQWFPILFGVFMTSMHLSIGYIRNLHRFYILAAFSSLLVVGLLMNQMETVLGFEFYSSLMGIAELVSGGITLLIFLHQNPLLHEEIL